MASDNRFRRALGTRRARRIASRVRARGRARIARVRRNIPKATMIFRKDFVGV